MARVEYLSVYYLSLLWWNISLCPFPVFLLDCLFFCCCVSKVSLFIFQILVLYQDIWFANIFSQSVDCLFNLHGIFCRAKFKLISLNLAIRSSWSEPQSAPGLLSADCLELLYTAAFELWCWRRLLRVPWTARISNQSILVEIDPEHS